MDLLSSASLSESVTSTRAVFRRLKRALFGGAFLFPTGSRSPCCSTRSIPIGGITKEKQLHFLDLTERLFGLKNQTSPSLIKCRRRTNEGAKGSKAFGARIFSWLPRNCRVAVRYFLAEEPIQNREQQDCCLIVEVHVPDRVDDQWVQQAAENAIEEEFGKALTLWSANEDEALQYLRPDPGATGGLLDLRSGVPLVWYILPIV
jgi:hypothetical protein